MLEITELKLTNLNTCPFKKKCYMQLAITQKKRILFHFADLESK